MSDSICFHPDDEIPEELTPEEIRKMFSDLVDEDLEDDLMWKEGLFEDVLNCVGEVPRAMLEEGFIYAMKRWKENHWGRKVSRGRKPQSAEAKDE